MLALLVVACAPAGAVAPRDDAPVKAPDLAGGRQVPSGPGSVLLVWGSDGAILRSEDGRDWRRATTPGALDLTQLSADGLGAVLIVVGAKGAVLRSIDSGRTWRAAKNRTVDTDLTTVVSAGARTWVAAGTAGRILRSIDDGKHWSLVDSHLGVTLRALRFDAASGRVLVGGDGGLVGFSTDRGESWQVTVISMPEPVTPIRDFHRVGDLLLATSASGRFLVSEDDGARWDLLQSSSEASYTDVVWDPDHGVIVMVGDNGDVLRSADGGRHWEGGEVMVDGQKDSLRAIRHDPRAHTLLVVGRSGTLARSTDAGATWTAASRDLRGEICGMLYDPDRGAFIAYGADGLLAHSEDSAAHWVFAR
jgi:photosystem II stability/assembly factor-like uncharacterized protein